MFIFFPFLVFMFYGFKFAFYFLYFISNFVFFVYFLAINYFFADYYHEKSSILLKNFISYKDAFVFGSIFFSLSIYEFITFFLFYIFGKPFLMIFQLEFLILRVLLRKLRINLSLLELNLTKFVRKLFRIRKLLYANNKYFIFNKLPWLRVYKVWFYRFSVLWIWILNIFLYLYGLTVFIANVAMICLEFILNYSYFVFINYMDIIDSFIYFLRSKFHHFMCSFLSFVLVVYKHQNVVLFQFVGLLVYTIYLGTFLYYFVICGLIYIYKQLTLFSSCSIYNNKLTLISYIIAYIKFSYNYYKFLLNNLTYSELPYFNYAFWWKSKYYKILYISARIRSLIHFYGK